MNLFIMAPICDKCSNFVLIISHYAVHELYNQVYGKRVLKLSYTWNNSEYIICLTNYLLT